MDQKLNTASRVFSLSSFLSYGMRRLLNHIAYEIICSLQYRTQSCIYLRIYEFKLYSAIHFVPTSQFFPSLSLETYSLYFSILYTFSFPRPQNVSSHMIKEQGKVVVMDPIRDRGVIKWQSAMLLPEHIRKLREFYREA